MATTDVTSLVLVTTLIFSVAMVFILLYVMSYNRRKRRHEEEKVQMQQAFEVEVARTGLEVMEQTMQTIGTDLHDNIGQLLSLTSFTLSSIIFTDDERTHEKVETAVTLTKKAIKEMRLLGKLLQGEQLLSQGLQVAVEQELQWLSRSDRFAVRHYISGRFDEETKQEVNLVIFRILQEILNNIMKHAQATLIELWLEQQADRLLLTVNDNGLGFDTGNGLPASGMGLKNMQRRAALIGGSTTITSAPGQGTRVVIDIPY